MMIAEHEIILPDMGAWESFVNANQDALTDQYGTIDKAFKHACDGGLTLGGGAAPLFFIRFAD